MARNKKQMNSGGPQFKLSVRVEQTAGALGESVDMVLLVDDPRGCSKAVAAAEILAAKWGGRVVGPADDRLSVRVRLPVKLATAMQVLEDTLKAKAGQNPFDGPAAGEVKPA